MNISVVCPMMVRWKYDRLNGRGGLYDIVCGTQMINRQHKRHRFYSGIIIRNKEVNVYIALMVFMKFIIKGCPLCPRIQLEQVWVFLMV